jgi:hypothetical protein
MVEQKRILKCPLDSVHGAEEDMNLKRVSVCDVQQKLDFAFFIVGGIF